MQVSSSSDGSATTSMAGGEIRPPTGRPRQKVMGVLLAVALALLVFQPAPAAQSTSSGASAASQQQGGPEGGAAASQPADAGAGQQQAQQPTSAPGNSSISDLFSIDRIRKDLERRPTIAFRMPDPELPRFRLEIEGYRAFKLPDWRSNFQLPPMSVPQPLGGADYYEMQRLITRPEAWGSAPFSNSDLVKMYGLSGAYGLAGVLIKKGLEARQSAAAEKARAEVQQELAEVEAHNARVAAGQADGDDAARKAAEKKKQDEKKKKKKKDDGGR